MTVDNSGVQIGAESIMFLAPKIITVEVIDNIPGDDKPESFC